MKRIKKQSLIIATYQFQNELKELNVLQSDRKKYIEEFVRWFNESFDYDLASSRVFDSIMSRVGKKDNHFKKEWLKKFNVSKDIYERAEDRAREVYGGETSEDEEFDWEKLTVKIAKIIAIEFGITLVAAIAIARNILSKK